ncbi:ABC transporter permease [Nakamurella lactea]|uniref:ABC transporter permease n=1 Tax=Nakamurella lactea TaxID=459515 RepID=UPI000404D5D6|nr:ABC transporter permease [Nakamurella lactea]
MFDTLVAGLIHGNAYALVAVGISLIFGVTHVANFAHGSVFAIGSMTGWWLIAERGWPLWLAIVGVLVVTGVIGLVLNVVAVRPLSKAPPIAALLATVAAALILDNVAQLVFGARVRAFPPALPTNNLQLGGVRFGTSDLVMFGVTIAVMGALAAFLKFGRAGQAIRATAQDPEAALQMGIPVPRIQNLAFVIASALGGLAGVFVGMYTSNISPSSGAAAGLTAFVAATLGGLGSMVGAVLGGFVLGIAEAFGISFWGDGVRDLITFGVLIIVLVLRPGGLLGRSPTITTEPLTGTFNAVGRAIRLKRWQVWLAVAVAAVVIPLLADNYTLTVGSQVAIYAIVAVSMTLISGSAGQITLGQAGPIAVGAYTAAILTAINGWSFWPALLLAGVVSAVVATVLTAPAWRLRGHYVAIATLGIGTVCVAVIRNWDSLTRGAYGISGIPAPSLFGFQIDDAVGLYLLALVVLLITIAVISRIRSSHLGTVLSAVGSDEIAARSAGVRARDYKALAFSVSAFFAGIAGALLAQQYTYIDPTVFNLPMSLLALTIIVLGGMSSPVGAVLGSIVLVGLPELLRITPDVRIIAYGVLLLLILRFRPQGLWVRSAAKRTDPENLSPDGQEPPSEGDSSRLATTLQDDRPVGASS